MVGESRKDLACNDSSSPRWYAPSTVSRSWPRTVCTSVQRKLVTAAKYIENRRAFMSGVASLGLLMAAKTVGCTVGMCSSFTRQSTLFTKHCHSWVACHRVGKRDAMSSVNRGSEMRPSRPRVEILLRVLGLSCGESMADCSSPCWAESHVSIAWWESMYMSDWNGKPHGPSPARART